MKRTTLILLIVLNILVLLGQLWPDGAPPFARWVNILFLAGSLGYFLQEVRRGPPART
ncbi:MAG TPA: hypothetical protein PLB89_06825 [Flavobacteriales bacterium]|nr:hypothetical protein [Flavobacteriales bacterium]